MKTQSFLSIYSITVNHGFTAIWATESTHRLNAPKVITRKTYAVNFQFLRRTKFARNSAGSRTFLDEKSLVRCEFESILRIKKKIPTDNALRICIIPSGQRATRIYVQIHLITELFTLFFQENLH